MSQNYHLKLQQNPYIVQSQDMKNSLYQNGESIRTITVTAENGDTRDYIIHITREITNNSYLASLSVDGYELDKNHYIINVPYSKNSLLAGEVTAIAEDTKATVQKTSGLVLSSSRSKYIYYPCYSKRWNYNEPVCDRSNKR